MKKILYIGTMKTCKKCNVSLVIGDNWLLSMEKNGNYKCKSCHNKITNIHYHNNSAIYKDQVKNHRQKTNNKFVVYLLENNNYVGTTQNINYRKAVHKHYGKDINAFKVLHECKTRDEALKLEKQYHQMGYEGKHIKNLYK